jgi:serine/threonine protein kinase
MVSYDHISYISIYLPPLSIFALLTSSIYLTFYPFIYLSTYLSIYRPIYPSFIPSISLSGEIRPILHRDLKPANILLDASKNIKIVSTYLSTDHIYLSYHIYLSHVPIYLPYLSTHHIYLFFIIITLMMLG